MKMVHSNEGWPESFGFSIAGDAPVVVVSVLANSVAESAGLHVGDQILEINDKNVQGLSKEQVIIVARRSSRVPPSLAVISRIRTFRLQRRRYALFCISHPKSRCFYISLLLYSGRGFIYGKRTSDTEIYDFRCYILFLFALNRWKFVLWFSTEESPTSVKKCRFWVNRKSTLLR